MRLGYFAEMGLMRKRVIGTPGQGGAAAEHEWLDLKRLATVEVTSENPAQPIELALALGQEGSGWRAGQTGEQTIRLIFDQPQQLRRVWLSFVETEAERAQEFVLRWSPDDGRSFQEIVRQQWNFDPSGSTREVEDYHVNLAGITILELTIIPDRSRRQVFASLDRLRLA